MLVVAASSWQFAGPGGGLNVQPVPMTVSGAANAIAKVPGAWLLATVNGGVWRTTDSVDTTQPDWTSVFDNSPVTCTSMTTLYVSPTNPNVVYAGCGGSTSSQQGYSWNVLNNGDWTGFAKSLDGGLTWKMAAFPPNYSVQSIAELATGEVLVATRGHFLNVADGGGIWRSSGNVFDAQSWTRTFASPVFSLAADSTSGNVFASTATLGASSAVFRSIDGGQTWNAASSGIFFSGGMVPFYSCLTMTPGKALFLGVMLSPPAFLSTGLGGGFGQVFYLNVSSTPSVAWQIVGAQPMTANPSLPSRDCSYNCTVATCCNSIDNDYAAKDRMALLVQPDDEGILYFAGNGGVLVYRIDWRRSLNQAPCTVNNSAGACYNSSVDMFIWKPMFNMFQNDTIDDQLPHCDFRNFAWDPDTASLLVVSDGGAYVRFKPNTTAGWWRGFNGNLGSFEFISISYDVAQDRWAAGAQDNNVHLSQPNCVAHAKENSVCWTGGDGTMTTVDNSVSPARLFGADQFASGLSFVQSNVTTLDVVNAALPVHIGSRGFPQRNSLNPMTQQSVMPFFQTPFSLNLANPQDMCFWVNVTSCSGEGPGVFCEGVMPVNGPNATLVLPTFGQNVLDFVAGGTLNGTLRSDVVSAVSRTHFIRKIGNGTTMYSFPVPFAEPCSTIYTSEYCNYSGAPVSCTMACQTWPNHATTMSLAVAPWDANTSAVSGWPDLTSNLGDEHIFLTTDGGTTFIDVIGNLVAATGTIGKARPMGLTFVQPHFLVAGTTRGVFAMQIGPSKPSWYRLGDVTEFPLVKVSANAYYPQVDVLMCATMGRGAWKLSGASAAIARAVSGSPASSPSSSNLGAIVVAAIGGTCALLVLVFFMRWRVSRSGDSRGDEYRNAERLQ